MADAKICNVAGCCNPFSARGFCQPHYRQFVRWGETRGAVPALPPCSVDGCGKPRSAASLCRNHHHRWKKHGDPLAGPTADGEPLRWLQDRVNWSGDACLIWPFCRRGGKLPPYGVLKFDGRREYAHRLMCTMAHGEPTSELFEAAHSCGNGHGGCVNPRHLRWDSKAGNAADRRLHGTENIGERNGQAKLTESEVRAIRDMAGREPQRETAARYGVCRQTVSDIHRGRRWASLD